MNQLFETVVLLEYEDEARAFLERSASATSSFDRTLIVALTPRVQIYLKERGIAYQNTLPYFDNQAHARVLEKTEAMLQPLEQNCDLPIALCTELIYRIRVLLSYLVWLVEILNAVRARHPEAKVLRTPPPRLPGDEVTWVSTPAERYLGALAKPFAQQHAMRFEEIAVPLLRGRQSPRYSPSRSGYVSRAMMRMFLGLLGLIRGRRPRVLLTARGYRMEQAAALVSREVPGLTWLELLPGNLFSLSVLKRLVKGLWLIIRPSPNALPLFPLPVLAFATGEPEVAETRQVENVTADLGKRIAGEWRDTFSHRGLELAPYAAHKMAVGCRNSLRALVARRPALRALLQTAHVNLALTPYSIELSNLVGYTCRELGIPAVMITHGTHVPPKNRAEEIELYRMSQGTILSPSYQYTVAQTPWARRHAEYYGVGEQTLNTEPLLFGKVLEVERQRLRDRIEADAETRLVVYAVTHHSSYGPRFYVFETEDEVLAAMADLVQAVNKLDRTHLVVKLHPAYPYSEDQLRLLLPQCDKLTVLQRIPFYQALSATDILVSFSSTTIEQAIYNRVPVLLYDKWQRYCHLDAHNCNQQDPDKPAAVYYTSRPDRLPAVLNYALDNSAVVRADDALYARHTFAPGEYQPFSEHLRRLLKLDQTHE